LVKDLRYPLRLSGNPKTTTPKQAKAGKRGAEHASKVGSGAPRDRNSSALVLNAPSLAIKLEKEVVVEIVTRQLDTCGRAGTGSKHIGADRCGLVESTSRA
jgi:hypothetical protein